jgi:hypothetical protein
MKKTILAGIGGACAAGAVIVAVIVVGMMGPNMPTPTPTDPLDNMTEPIPQNAKLGLVINTPNQSTSLQELSSIYSEAASTGIGRSNLYLFWNHIEPEKNQFNWEQSDILMSFNKKNDLKVTLFFSIVNGKTIGPFPDWIGKPPLYKVPSENLIKALDAVLSRYDIIDSVIIAGETDAHFRYNERDIPLYNDLFTDIYDSLKEKHPDVKIGNLFSLHGVINKNLPHIVDEVAVGDFIAFSYLPVDPLNDIVKTPKEAGDDLLRMFDIVGANHSGTKIALFEVSWSTSGFVNGSDSDQAEFVDVVLDFYSENEDNIEFITWYRQHDRPEGTCITESTIQTIPEGSISIGGESGLGTNEFVVERLGHYICGAGLIDNFGNPKPAWQEFKTQIPDTITP